MKTVKNYKYSIKTALLLFAIGISNILAQDEVTLDTLFVDAKIEDVSSEEIKSADLAEALMQNLPSVSLVRRSGIANDVILRGQKKDNINILIDNAKIYGACPNRMDPATSHILTNNIQSIEVIEGPYDVENFGTLSGAIKITTKTAKTGFNGEVNLNIGSFGYQKLSSTLSGANEKISILVSASKEQSNQYLDGDGNTPVEQHANATDATTNYQNRYKNMKAYEKQTLMTKITFAPTKNQKIGVSYTKNESDDILYSSSKMDALYDDSTIATLDYSVNNLGLFSKELNIEYYNSYVKHPMTTAYRQSVATNGEIVSNLTSSITGAKIKNYINTSNMDLMIGLDSSFRNWDGDYFKDGSSINRKSISDVDTKNSAIFAKITTKNIAVGFRYDTTTITPNASIQLENDYKSLSVNIMTNIFSNNGARYFIGVGKSSRVPDARELYFKNMMGMEVGTPTLEQTTNTEFDVGVEKSYDSSIAKVKLFFSNLSDYIYYNSSKTKNNFENVDATIYGLELSGAVSFGESFDINYGAAYQRGEKKDSLEGQSDKDLAEIPPLKINIATNYVYDNSTSAKLELIAADGWSNYDRDNGEQEIDAYQVINMKFKKTFIEDIELSVGVNNIADKTYAVSNTYKDLTLISGGDDIMLMNEPGRYVYTNLRYRF